VAGEPRPGDVVAYRFKVMGWVPALILKNGQANSNVLDLVVWFPSFGGPTGDGEIDDDDLGLGVTDPTQHLNCVRRDNVQKGNAPLKWQDRDIVWPDGSWPWPNLPSII
jgi:hypothetical protein